MAEEAFSIALLTRVEESCSAGVPEVCSPDVVTGLVSTLVNGEERGENAATSS